VDYEGFLVGAFGVVVEFWMADLAEHFAEHLAGVVVC